MEDLQPLILQKMDDIVLYDVDFSLTHAVYDRLCSAAF